MTLPPHFFPALTLFIAVTVLIVGSLETPI
jgi:hypothetical protein